MTCQACSCRGGSQYPYSAYLYDRYPPVQCPDDFFRPEMCDHLANGFGCGIYPPPPPPAHWRTPPGERGDIETPRHPMTPTIIYPDDPRHGVPMNPAGRVAGPVVITQADLAWYYNAYMRNRAIQQQTCPPPPIPSMRCSPRWEPQMLELPPGLIGAETFRPEDAYPSSGQARQEVEQASSDYEQAVAYGDPRQANEAARALEQARARLVFAIAREREALANQQAEQDQQETKAPDKGLSTGGWAIILGAVAATATAAYAYRRELGLTEG